MIFIVFLLSQFAFASTQMRIAVLEFRGIDIQESALTLLADDVREGVLVAVKQEINQDNYQPKYLVMTRENMMSILKEMGKGIEECVGECEVEIARNIGADYVISGEVYLIEDQYILSLKIHDTQGGHLLGREEAKSAKLTELFDKATDSATQLISESLQISPTKINSTEQVSIDTNANPEKRPETYQITFTSIPSGASVYVDNKLLCNTTPCDKYLSKGTHAVKYSLQRHANYLDTIEVLESTIFSANLRSHFGTYTIHSAPLGLEVYEKNTLLGTTPFEVDLTPGSHQLSIKDKCYQSSTTEVFSEEDENDDIYINILERRSGLLIQAYIDDKPIKTDVFIDGEKRGKTGKQIEIPLCSQEVQIKHKNYRWTQEIKPREDKVLRLEADLRKSPVKNRSNGKTYAKKAVIYTVAVIYYVIIYLI